MPLESGRFDHPRVDGWPDQEVRPEGRLADWRQQLRSAQWPSGHDRSFHAVHKPQLEQRGRLDLPLLQRDRWAAVRWALTFASQMTEMESLRAESTFGNIIRGLQVYGYKVVKGEALTKLYVRQ